MTVDREIDVVGKACPMPIIALAKAARELSPGQTVRISGNDPIFESSIVELCAQQGHTVVETVHEGRIVRMVVRLGAARGAS